MLYLSVYVYRKGIAMSAKDKIAKVMLNMVTDAALKHISKDPDKNIPKFAARVLNLFGGIFPGKSLDGIKKGASDPNNTYTKLAKNIINDTDPEIIKKLIYAFFSVLQLR